MVHLAVAPRITVLQQGLGQLAEMQVRGIRRCPKISQLFKRD